MRSETLALIVVSETGSDHVSRKGLLFGENLPYQMSTALARPAWAVSGQGVFVAIYSCEIHAVSHPLPGLAVLTEFPSSS